MDRSLLLVSIAGERAAVASEIIRSVVELDGVTPVPRAPEHIAGLAALSGPEHGGHYLMAKNVIVAHLNSSGTGVPALAPMRPGFGHPLYPDGDPRAKLLLEMMKPLPQAAGVLALAWFSHGVMVAWTRPPERLYAWCEVALAVAIVLAASLTGLRARFAARAARH